MKYRVMITLHEDGEAKLSTRLYETEVREDAIRWLETFIDVIASIKKFVGFRTR